MTINSISCNSTDEAARVLSDNRNARIFGGGTLVMRAINEGERSFDTLVRVCDDVLQRIDMVGSRLVLGAGVSMAAVAGHRDCAFLAPVARSVGGPAVRNMATVGGNLFAASPYGDFTTALLVLDAEISIAGESAAVPILDFLQRRDAEPGRLVTSVSLIRPTTASEFRFLKISRVKPKGISLMTLAARLPQNAGTLSGVRVAYGAMGPVPARVPAVENALESQALNSATVEAASRVATAGINPPTDALASAWYRQEVAPVHLRRLLLG